MVVVHAEANATLEALAIAKGLKVPTRLDAEHQSTIEFFKGKSGDEFDAAYMRHIATANAKTMALFGRASRLNDVELATFARNAARHSRTCTAGPKLEGQPGGVSRCLVV